MHLTQIWKVLPCSATATDCSRLQQTAIHYMNTNHLRIWSSIATDTSISVVRVHIHGRVSITASTEIETPPKSTKSRN